MKILVTGATGFVGRHLLPALRSRGHEVIAYDRHRPEVPKVDAVVNMAGATIAQRWTAPAKQEVFNSRIETTRKVIAACEGAHTFLSVSATGFYGSRGDELLDERSSAGSGFLADVCRAWEAEVTGSAFVGRKVILRLPPVLGPDGGMLAKLLLPFRMGVGGRLGDGQQWMSWIEIQDLITMFTTLLEDKTLEGVFCAVAPEPVTNVHFTKALGAVLHRPTVLPVPRFALSLTLGEMATMLLESQRVVPRRLQELNFPFRFRSIEPALRSVLALPAPKDHQK